MTKTSLTIQLPRMPNFVKLSNESMIDVAELDTATLTQLGADWTAALIVHAKTRKEILASIHFKDY